MPTHEFIAGTLALSFVDTLGGRSGTPVERLSSPSGLRAWLMVAGLVIRPEHKLDERDGTEFAKEAQAKADKRAAGQETSGADQSADC